MTVRGVFLCVGCSQRIEPETLSTDPLAGDRCNAFPEGIPDFILAGGDHRTPVEGDGGIVFTPNEIGDKVLAAWEAIREEFG